MSPSGYDMQIPDELKDVANRHQQHVADLLASLRCAGLDDHRIERSVDAIVASYRSELMAAVQAMKTMHRA